MTRRARVLAVVPVIFVFAVGAFVLLSSAKEGGSSKRLSGLFPNQPIPGVEVTEAQASKRLGYEPPLLPNISLVDKCSGRETTVKLLQVFVSSPDSLDSQSGMTYSNGIWMSVTPVSHYAQSIQKAGELPPVDAWFTEVDRPDQLTTGTVHGKTAWVKELSSDFSCEGATFQAVPNTKSVEGSPVPEPPIATMYDPTTTGDVTWLENGLVIDISGPYSVQELTALAEGVRVNREAPSD